MAQEEGAEEERAAAGETEAQGRRVDSTAEEVEGGGFEGRTAAFMRASRLILPFIPASVQCCDLQAPAAANGDRPAPRGAGPLLDLPLFLYHCCCSLPLTATLFVLHSICTVVHSLPPPADLSVLCAAAAGQPSVSGVSPLAHWPLLHAHASVEWQHAHIGSAQRGRAEESRQLVH